MHAIQDQLLKIRLHLYPGSSPVSMQDKEAFLDNTTDQAAPLTLAACVKLFHQGKTEEAAAHLINLVESHPEEQLAYVYLAFTCAARNMDEDAGVFIKHAKDMAPLPPAYGAGLGEIFLKANNSTAAQHYLEAAIAEQADLFAAYPALAEAMRRNGQQTEAVQLLECVAGIPSDAQDNIIGLLVEWLTAQGNITGLSGLCLRLHNNPAQYALGLALAPRTEIAPSKIADIVQAVLSEQTSPPVPQAHAGQPLTIAFLVSDCTRERVSGRLETLLLHLPTQQFKTVLLCNDPRAHEEAVQRLGLISDRSFDITEKNDSDVVDWLTAMNAQILVDMDGLGIRHRFSLFLAASVPVKLSWSDASLPLAAGIPCLLGSALWRESDAFPAREFYPLPGLGEHFAFPDYTIQPRQADSPFSFGCLCTAAHYSEDNWRLFAQLLAQESSSRLVINLGELDEAAKSFISTHFERAGVELSRLCFVRATTPAAVAETWNRVDVGLAPLHGPGDMALPLALWMEKPFLALSGDAVWSRRPGALLRTLGQDDCIAESPDTWLTRAIEAVHNGTDTRLVGLRQRIVKEKITGHAADFVQGFAELVEQLHQKAC